MHRIGVWSRGIGMRFSSGTNLAFRADYAVLGDRGGNPTAPKEEGASKVHFSFSYIF